MEKQNNFANTGTYLFVALFLLFSIIVIKTAWVGEDSYIAFRVVDNFVNGYGLRWNILERVQVYTNPLWVLLVSCFYYVTNEIFITVSILSIVISLLSSYWLAKKVSLNIWIGSLGLLALSSSRSFIDYTTSGLENPLSYLLAIFFFWIYLTKELDIKNYGYLILFASLSAVNRLDLILLFIPPILYSTYILYQSQHSNKDIFLKCLVFSSPLICWLLFSLFYYGVPFPNTYYAKLNTGIASSEVYIQGFRYFLNSLNYDTITLLLIFFAIILAFNSRDFKKIAVASGLVLYSLYVIKIGGDFMSGRFFSVPYIIAVALLVRFDFTKETKVVLGALILLVAFAVKHPTFLNDEDYEAFPQIDFTGSNVNSIVDHMGIADERGAFFQEAGLTVRLSRSKSIPSNSWVMLGNLERLKGTKVKIWPNVGYFGFYAGPGVHIIDPYGLGDPLISKLSVPKENQVDWRIGHFMRNVPNGYEESIRKNKNLITNAYLSKYYDVTKILTSKDLFSFERLETIIKFNFGYYDDLLIGYNLLPERLSNKKDFIQFLSSNPYTGITGDSYKNEIDRYYELFQETGKFRWKNNEWHHDKILPLWKKFKRDRNLLDLKKYANIDDFKRFLSSNPYPSIDSTSYSSGEDTLMWNLFQENTNFSWEGNEWHKKHVLPLWKLFKKDQNILDVPRNANQADFQNFIMKKPHPSIDSTSYDFGTSDFYFQLFQNTGKYSWEGQEWHRDSVQYLWNDYKFQNSIL